MLPILQEPLIMSTVEKISIALSPELHDAVRRAVASGKYASASEVIREALRDWSLREPLREAEIERLRRQWNEGLGSGDSQRLDLQNLKQEARKRLSSG
jgi:antitoxin ParD1/3/4